MQGFLGNTIKAKCSIRRNLLHIIRRSQFNSNALALGKIHAKVLQRHNQAQLIKRGRMQVMRKPPDVVTESACSWGNLYNQFKGEPFDTDKLEKQVAALLMDEDVTKKSGIYRYILTGEERHLNIRQFSENQRREAYERQTGICIKCNKHFELNEMEADHATSWHEGGRTSAENCQPLCKRRQP